MWFKSTLVFSFKDSNTIATMESSHEEDTLISTPKKIKQGITKQNFIYCFSSLATNISIILIYVPYFVSLLKLKWNVDNNQVLKVNSKKC